MKLELQNDLANKEEEKEMNNIFLIGTGVQKVEETK